jgi:hypothetical protein
MVQLSQIIEHGSIVDSTSTASYNQNEDGWNPRAEEG